MRLPLTPVSIMNFAFALGVSFVLIFDRGLFENSANTRMYQFFLDVSPQIGYGFFAFTVALVIFAAFITKNCWLEIIGLLLSGALQIFILSGYMLTFPNIGSVAFFVWTLTTFMTVVDILNRMQDKRDRRRRIISEIHKEALEEQFSRIVELDRETIEKKERIANEKEAEEIERLELIEEEVKRFAKQRKKGEG